MIALHRHVFLQIPDATDAEPKPLIVVVPVHISVVTVHVPVPGIGTAVLSSTPPVSVVPNIVVITIGVTVPTRKSRKK